MSDRGTQDYDGTVYERVHPILGHMLRAAEVSVRPLPPYHLGGPRPLPPAIGLASLGVWFAETARPEIDQFGEVVAAEYDVDLSAARGYIAAPDRPEVHAELAKAWAAQRRNGTVADIAGMVVVACWNAANRKTDRMAGSLAPCGLRLVKLYAEAGRGAETTALLEEVDRRLCLSECEAAVRRYGTEAASGHPAQQIARLRFRGDRGNGTAGHFVVELADGSWGAVTKLNRRYRWIRGTREHVLATLPESVFAAGVDQVLGPG